MVVTSYSLILGFILILWYSMSVLASYIFMKCVCFIFRVLKKKRPKSFKGTCRMARLMGIYEPILVFLAMSFVGIIVIFLSLASGRNDFQSIVSSIIITAVFIMLVPNVYYVRNVKKEKKRKHLIFIVISALFLFFTVSGMSSIISDAGMGLIGIKKNNATFLLKENDLEMARHLVGDKEQTFFKGDALFTGVGTTSLLVINKKKMVVNNENLTLSY
ncbi:hypothetical protein SAMN02744775_03964 [Enterobacter sp. CC120223-11]|nr:hypothetical protein SAMN02744775_03964 [Enterobacter sp. CC120223-11]